MKLQCKNIVIKINAIYRVCFELDDSLIYLDSYLKAQYTIHLLYNGISL